jgi:hypothetical protein
MLPAVGNAARRAPARSEVDGWMDTLGQQYAAHAEMRKFSTSAMPCKLWLTDCSGALPEAALFSGPSKTKSARSAIPVPGARAKGTSRAIQGAKDHQQDRARQREAQSQRGHRKQADNLQRDPGAPTAQKGGDPWRQKGSRRANAPSSGQPSKSTPRAKRTAMGAWTRMGTDMLCPHTHRHPGTFSTSAVPCKLGILEWCGTRPQRAILLKGLTSRRQPEAPRHTCTGRLGTEERAGQPKEPRTTNRTAQGHREAQERKRDRKQARKLPKGAGGTNTFGQTPRLPIPT